MLNINPEDVLKNERWLDIIEIQNTLEGISHIVMAAPTGYKDREDLVHFSLFLNTQDDLPADIARNVMEKFAFDNQISDIDHITHDLADIAFAVTNKETPMPIHIEEKDEGTTTTQMYLIDFTGRSPLFEEAAKGMTGWSYIKA